jgi:SAM-dependent methyltransferase
MDAEHLDFPDGSFDFVWSWGVIHHSSDTRKILREIWRVLKPGGKCTVMVYHTSPWNNLIRGALYYGILRGGFLRGRSIHRLLQETTDGALARYYTFDEWESGVSGVFDVTRMTAIGHKTQILPVPAGRIKEFLGSLIPNAFGRWLTNRQFFGYMMVAEMTKIG